MNVSAVQRDRTRRLPGLDGIWALIGADSLVFAILFASFMTERRRDPALFEASRLTLNVNLGGVDTLILLTSSWLVALSIHNLRRDQTDRAARFLLGGALTGLLFTVSKVVEYTAKITDGITPATNSFYMWYFTLTGIHLLHVLLGTGLLTVMWLRVRGGRYRGADPTAPESAASFWHLVDYVWIVLFPLLYLMKAH